MERLLATSLHLYKIFTRRLYSEGLPLPIRVGSFRFHFSITASFDEQCWTRDRQYGCHLEIFLLSSAFDLFINLVVNSFVWIRYHSHFDELGCGQYLYWKQLQEQKCNNNGSCCSASTWLWDLFFLWVSQPFWRVILWTKSSWKSSVPRDV